MKTKTIVHNFYAALGNFFFLFLTGIVFLPYYFRFITTTDYGIWLGGISLISLILIFEANMGLILTQILADKKVKNERIEFSKYFTAAFLYGSIIGILIMLLSFFYSSSILGFISKQSHPSALFSNSFFLFSLSIALTIFSANFSVLLQVFFKTELLLLFNVISMILGISVTIFFVPSHGIMAIAGGNLVKVFVSAFFSVFYGVKIMKVECIYLNIDFSFMRKLLVHTIWPFFSRIGIVTAVSIQSFIIATSISPSSATVFDITRKIPITIQSLINFIAFATFTSFTSLYAEENMDSKVNEYSKKYYLLISLLLIISLSGVFIVGQNFIGVWVGGDKFGGNVLLGLLCLTSLTDQLRLLLAQQYTVMGRSKLTSISEIAFAMSFGIAVYFLISKLGLYGIVLALLIANFIYFISCFVLERKQSTTIVGAILNKGLISDLLLIIIIDILIKFISTYLQVEDIFWSVILVVIFVVILFLILHNKIIEVYNFIKPRLR
jgi:O-antigen/teichoic acid export membrane protein